MFRRAATVTIIEALRRTYDDEFKDGGFGIIPRHIEKEYPEEEGSWPAILVQFRPSRVSWTGINPNMIKVYGTDEDWEGEGDPGHIREGGFDGSVDLTVLALSAGERDRMWDELTEVLLMGDLHPVTRRFADFLNESPVIRMTPQLSAVQVVGDSISPGVPWDPNVLAYEASLRFDVTGQFWADVYKRELRTIEDIQIISYDDQTSPVPGDEDVDEEGPWL